MGPQLPALYHATASPIRRLSLPGTALRFQRSDEPPMFETGSLALGVSEDAWSTACPSCLVALPGAFWQRCWVGTRNIHCSHLMGSNSLAFAQRKNMRGTCRCSSYLGPACRSQRTQVLWKPSPWPQRSLRSNGGPPQANLHGSSKSKSEGQCYAPRAFVLSFLD